MNRESQQRYWLYGMHAVKAALGNPAREMHQLWATSNALARLQDILAARAQHRTLPAPERITAHEFQRILSKDAVHQGVALQVSPLPEVTLPDWLQRWGSTPPDGPLVVLDQVTDPHNVGAIFRSAAAFAACGVLTTRRHSPPENAILAKTACGALEHVPYLRVANLAQSLRQLHEHGWWCFGLDAGGTQDVAHLDWPERTALVLGAEGKGLRPLTAAQCQNLVRIALSEHMPSLNVSNATAIALHAVYCHRDPIA